MQRNNGTSSRRSRWRRACDREASTSSWANSIFWAKAACCGAAAHDRLGSVIFYGPPGTGKTTLAQLLAQETRARFQELSAVSSGVKDLRVVLSEARDELAATGRRTLLFVDEIHRFNRAQQDALLHDVEDGVVILVGATTSNPFFAVNAALVSRSQIFQFEPLSSDEIKYLLRTALADKQRGLGTIAVDADEEALEYLAAQSDGDARRALSALEVAVRSTPARPSAWIDNWPPNRCSGKPWSTMPRATRTTTAPVR